jgi:hypothetical protein
MKKTLLLVSILLFSQSILAGDDPEQFPPLDPKFMAVHGMVLMNNGSALYVSNLPSYDEPHNTQLIYAVAADDAALLKLVRDADLVTIKPRPFNLQRLMRDERVSIKADVYMGHFERGGMLVFEGIDMLLDEQIYMRSLEELEPSSWLQKYDTVELRGKQKILIHQIQPAPSYEHIILLYQDVNCVTQFATRSKAPSEDKLLQKLSFCGSLKPLYYDTKDLGK